MAATPSASSFAIENVRLFDGGGLWPVAHVRVEDGAIAAVQEGRSNEDVSSRIDGAGCTLLPGLIDSHVHAWGPLERVLGRYLLFGVTTALEMECDGDGLVEAHALRSAAPPQTADLYSSGFAVTVTGGHGTEYGFPVPVVDSVEGVDAFVAARAAEGSDYIKVIYNDPRWSEHTLSEPMVAAAVRAARARGLRVTVHVNSLRTATHAIASGADALAHIFADEFDDGFASFVKAHGAFVCPTLTMPDAFLNAGDGEPRGDLTQDPRIAPFLTSFDRRWLSSSPYALRAELGLPEPPSRRAPRRFDIAQRTTKELFDAGVPVLAGTDAPNPGTAHGASMHRELELLVEAGLKPIQALAAGTSVPARCFDLGDRGRIATGLRADLLLVRGDPTTDITCTRDIVGVWKAGTRVERVPREAPRRPGPQIASRG